MIPPASQCSYSRDVRAVNGRFVRWQ